LSENTPNLPLFPQNASGLFLVILVGDVAKRCAYSFHSNYPAAAGERIEDVAAGQPQHVRIGLPPWMLSHING
jgi:hypothetical protein